MSQAIYQEFLRSKAQYALPVGFQPSVDLCPRMFPFQKAITTWALNRGRAAVFADCGLGKTLIEQEWARQVHQHTGKPILIFAPLAVSDQMVREGKKFGIPVMHAHIPAELGAISATNYERLHLFSPPDQFGGLILDECFLAGAAVDTPFGFTMPIEEIRRGQLVSNAIGTCRVTACKSKELYAIVHVETSAGGFWCSENHPFFSLHGLVGASILKTGDVLYGQAYAMRVLQKEAETEQESVLQQILLGEVEDAPAGNRSSGAHGRDSRSDRKEGVGLAARRQYRRAETARANTKTKPILRSKSPCQDFSYSSQDALEAASTGRKRPRADYGAVGSLRSTWRRLVHGVRNLVRKAPTAVSDLLQSRHSAPAGNARCGSGWLLPRFQENTGSEKGAQVEFARVDRVTIYQQGDPEFRKRSGRKNTVTAYDLQVAGHPSYSINGVLVHNSSILKSTDGKTRTALIQYAKAIPYRLAATATPAPNDFMELGNHAEFLDVLSRAEMLATFFTHDGGETAKWRLKGHAKKPFWKWVASWAVALRKPSDLGFEDNGFILPPLKILPVEVEDNYKSRGRLISVEAVTLEERRDVRRQTIPQRVAACADLVSKQPKEPWLIWCNLNAEGDALEKAIPGSVQVSGSDSEDVKEKALNDFSLGRIRVLITKPTIAGFGMNWQHCHNVVFVGLSDSYEQFYQAIRRCWRFGQTHPVSAWVITSTSEGAVVRNIKRKELQADEMMNGIVADMKSEVVKNLNVPTQHQSDALQHDIAKSKRWTAILGDCTDEVKAIPDASIDYCIFSPPFSSLYTYTSSLRDMGNCRNDAEFFQHFDFLAPELLRVVKPGRLISVHCANLTILKSRSGYIGLRDFRGELIWLLQRAGFIFHSEVCIWKDPLVAMQRSKALGLLHKQIVKDSSLCIQGTPDYLITFRKPGDNGKPITHKPNGFQSYIGEQKPKAPKHPVAAKNKFSHEVWQRYASPVWTDISQSKTLQYRAAREQNDERHIAPLQLQVVERALELWSKPNDLVLSPFLGIGTEGYVSLKMGRRFIGVELKPSYWSMAVKNLKYAEQQASRKKLF